MRTFERGQVLGKLPSPSGRGWPAAGAFTSRSGPGEGLLGEVSKLRLIAVSHGLGRNTVLDDSGAREVEALKGAQQRHSFALTPLGGFP